MQINLREVDYQKRVKETVNLNQRLDRGARMLRQAIKDGDVSRCSAIIDQFVYVANLFSTMSKEALLYHQFHALGFKRLPDCPEGVTEVDPWTLMSMETLVTIFGREDTLEMIEIIDS